MKRLRAQGGRQMEQYLEKKWSLQLHPKFVKSCQLKVAHYCVYSAIVSKVT